MKSAIHIRAATRDDLPDIARIHVHSWQQTYAGLVPQEYLDNLSIAARQKKWEEIYNGDTSEEANLYIASDEFNETVGFISFGRSRDKRKAGWGEIYAVYLLKQSWGKGIGHALFNKVRQYFLENELSHVYLWVLDTNQHARNAYTKWGGKLDPEHVTTGRIGSQEITEVMMTFQLSNLD